MKLQEFTLRSLRKIHDILPFSSHDWHDTSRVQYWDQQANDYVRARIAQAENGLMISKFGTIELNAVCCCKRLRQGLTWKDYWDYIRRKGCIYPHESLEALYMNAGFFPMSEELQERYADMVLQDVAEIDILGSYVDQETYLNQELKHCVKINLYGYCAPFAWKNPWTELLRGRRVLVVHPFAESIRRQYEKREFLFDDPAVLPSFQDLTVIQAVQSIAGNGRSTGFTNWFEALESMKAQIDCCDYEIALIGCGAYGMNLAAHCRRKGKIAVHMASWVQMLFGIYGERWIHDQPEYAGFINQYWTRPLPSERPKGAEKIENAAYW